MRKTIAATVVAMVCAGCGNVDGPSTKGLIGDWSVKSIGGYALPVVVKSGNAGAIHTLYSSLTLSLRESGAATFSYDVSDLDDLDDSVDVHETCTSVVQTHTGRGIVTLHVLSDGANACPQDVIEGAQFTINGDELIYNWNGYRAILKQKP